MKWHAQVILIIVIFILLLNSSILVQATNYNVSGNFSNSLIACIEWTGSGSEDRCDITTSGLYSFIDAINVNATTIRIDTEARTETGFMGKGSGCNGTSGKNNDYLIGDDFTACTTQRALFRILNKTLFNDVMQGVLDVKDFWMFQVTKRDLTSTDNTVYLSRITDANKWNVSDANWANTSNALGTPWVGEPGCNQSIIDYDLINISWTFTNTQASTGRYHNWTDTLWTDWFNEWVNESRANNGFTIRKKGDESGGRNYVIFDAVDDSNPAYWIINSTNFNVTTKDVYNFTENAIYINQDDVVVDCKGAILEGDKGAGDYGIEITAVDNVTIQNCTIKDFGVGVYINTGASNIKLIDVTGIGFRTFHSVGDNVTTINLRSINSSATAFAMVFGGNNYNMTNTSIFNCQTSAYCLSTDTLNNATINGLIINSTGASTEWAVSISSGSENKNVTISSFEININNSVNGGIITGGSTSNNISFYDGFVRGGGDCISVATASTFFNNVTLQNCSNGFVVTDHNGTFTNGAFINVSGDGVRLSSNAFNWSIINNTFTEVGNAILVNQFLAGQSFATFGGNNFNTIHIVINSALGSTVLITANDTDVTSLVTGLNDFRLWLVDIPAAAIPFTTAWVEEPPSLSCAVVAGAYGGTCYLDEANYMTGNGAVSDYTFNTATASSIISPYADPPYIKFSSVWNQLNHSMSISSDDNIIKGNIFNNDSNGVPYYIELVSGADNNNISLNHFRYAITGGISDSGSNNQYCINDEGNYYEETITVPSDDCGPINITTNTTNKLALDIRPVRQSSILPLVYHYIADGITHGTFNPSIPFNLPIGTSNVTVYAFDGIVNSTKVFTTVSTPKIDSRILIMKDTGRIIITNGTTRIN